MKNPLRFIWMIGLLIPNAVLAQCIPTSAQVCVAGDDTTQVWVNGSYIGSKDYCNQGSGCSPDSLCLPVPLDKLPGPQVCLAFETSNVNPVLVFSSWKLEVDCKDGRPFLVTNEDPAKSGVSLYWDPTGASTCCPGHAPPVDGKGNNWTDLDYNPASNPFTMTGEAVTSNTWAAAHLLNPQKQFIIPYISYTAEGAGSGPASACGILYWRQIAKLPPWASTPTPTVVIPPTPTFTPIPTSTPKPIPTPTKTPRPPVPTATPKPPRRPKATPTPPSRPWPAPTATPRKIRIKPTPTYAPLRPTPTPRPLRRPTWTPVPIPQQKPTPMPAWLPPIDKSAAIVFQTPPVEVYLTFADGSGRYQLEVVDSQGHPLEMIFDKKIVGEKDAWAMWDGKDGQGQQVPIGQYFVIFYKDGKPLRSISVYRSGMGTNP